MTLIVQPIRDIRGRHMLREADDSPSAADDSSSGSATNPTTCYFNIPCLVLLLVVTVLW